MSEKMSIEGRYELIARTSSRYRAANLQDKKQILDEFIAASGYTRKHAIYVLNNAKARTSGKRKRPAVYDTEVKEALVDLWQYANRICSKRLAPFLPDLIDALTRHGRITLKKSVKAKLLAMSPATMDRLLKIQRKRIGQSYTRSGPPLRKQIPIRTFADWNDVAAGFLEADLVAHCGDNVSGRFLQTLVVTDINTSWTEPFCIIQKGEEQVLAALREIGKVLPFPIQGLDTDNGTEFMNHGLIQFCEENKVTFTRSRPYKKNDQCHVEEKNGSVVRRVVGYQRYEGAAAQDAFNKLYSVLRLYVNFFQPTMKLLSKERTNSKIKKQYEKAQTPYRRVLKSAVISTEQKQKLKETYLNLDPTQLLYTIEELQDELVRHATGYDTESLANDERKRQALESIETKAPRLRTKGKRRRRAGSVAAGTLNTASSVASENLQRIAGEAPSYRAKRIAMESLLKDD